MEASSKTIFALNNSILHQLICHLRLEDKLKLALVSDHFKNVIECEMHDEELDLTVLQINFTISEAIVILSKYGNAIRRFRAMSSFDNDEKIEYAKLIPTYCPNLEEIYLHGLEITMDNAYGQLLAISTNVRSLKLKKCALGNAACSLLQKLHRLQLVDLEGSKLTGKGLNKLESIEHLNLKNCRNFKCKIFIDICRSNKLKTLNIAGLQQSTCGALRTLIATQSELNTLVLGDKYWMKQSDRFCRVGCLREVSLIGCYEKTLSSYVKELVAHRKDKLECLEVNLPLIFSENTEKLVEIVNGICDFSNLRILSFRNCMLYENTDIIKIGRSCRHLEMLDLQGSSFTDMGILGCVEYLEKLRHLDISYCEVKRSLYSRLVEDRKTKGCCDTLVVYIRQKMDLEAILKCEEYFGSQHIVKLTKDSMRSNSDTSITSRLEKQTNKYHTHNFNPKIVTPSPETIPMLSLTDLGDHCLYEIIKHLEPIERLTLVLATKRFDHVLKYFLRTDLIDIIKIMANFTVREATEIFSRCGFMMRRLLVQTSAYHFDIEYFNLADKYCKYLEELQFFDIHLGQCVKKATDIIASSAETLKIIKMKFWDCDDSVVFEISKAKNLHTLILKGSSITGKHLKKLSNIKKLDLGKCTDLKADYFTKLCYSNRFKELDIRGCEKIDGTSFEAMVETQTEIERLTLGGFYAATNIHIASQLKNLIDISLRQCIPQEIIEVLNALSDCKRNVIRFLAVKYSGEVTATLLPSFRESILHFPNLIYLRLPSLNIVDNAFMKRIVKACPRLEILDVHSGTNLSDEGILEAVNALKNLRHFDVKFCNVNNFINVYQRCVATKKERLDSFPLILYIQIDGERLYYMIETKEYKVMQKYVILSDEWAHDIDKQKYIEERTRKGKIKAHSASLVQDVTHVTNLAYILNLPDACLLKIASQLKATEKLKFAFSSKRLFHAMKPLISETLFDINEISRAFTLSETRKLLQECSGAIRRLQFAVSRLSTPIEYLLLFQPYSESLTEISVIDALDVQLSEVGKLLSTPSQKLEKISFKHCFQIDGILTEILNKREESINPFENLIELHFRDCDYLQPEHFMEFCQNCKLKRLDIRSCKSLRNEEFSALVASQSDCLDWLGISCQYAADNFTDVALLTSLRHICIDVYDAIQPLQTLLDKLVKYRRNDLLTLVVTNREHRTLDYSLINQVVEERCKMFAKLKNVEINQPKPYIKSYQLDS